MPRDNKTPLIQKIAKQAHTTFEGWKPTASGDNKLFAEQQENFNSSTVAAELQSPPVTYMHICETEVFSMGVFLLRSGASIPLHDHPGMNGMLKVLYGKVSVRCFDKLENNLSDGSAPPQLEPPLAMYQTSSLRRSVLRSVVELSETSGPCLLTPLRDNLHQIDTVEGPAAFLDILAPPYNPDDGRDCHYYKVLQTVSQGGTEGKSNEEQQGKEKEEETWLLEIPQPDDFWCGGEAYPGPAVSF
ncbi:hypothetical protein PBY51_002164 [Eleginops maclovinus]|uniref:2-aminoethanethiol dioxygenase n=1 Tax=Eleginops maclovinus TaxID=56733 RepID=A0AAN7WYV6_ELEMC|nr:hypothetical protein PBY51_002164 [Eleginops maclovinus]